jgi:hypothetical protein
VQEFSQMGKLTGTILIIAGVALAAAALSARDRTPLDVAAPQADEAVAHPVPLLPPDEGANLANAAPAAAPAPPPQLTPPPAEKAAAPRASVAAKFFPPPTVRIAEAPPRVPVGQNEPASAPVLGGEGLTREIQRELKRAGCYGGAITGAWSPAVRRAMKAFTDRVNAALPVEQPDQILLALMQSHRQATCSASCPRGQSLAEDGRCLPDALVARKQPAAPAKVPDESAVAAAPEPAASPLPGRMSLAGPRAEPPPPVKGPAEAKAPSTNSRTRHSTRRQRHTGAHRHAQRYRGVRRYPGFPGWASRAFDPWW